METPRDVRTQFNQSWHDVENSGRAQERSRKKPRQVIILPDRKVAEREIDGQRRGSQKQPDDARRPGLS